MKIETKKLEFKAAPRIEAKNESYVPRGGEKKVRKIFDSEIFNLNLKALM